MFRGKTCASCTASWVERGEVGNIPPEGPWPPSLICRGQIQRQQYAVGNRSGAVAATEFACFEAGGEARGAGAPPPAGRGRGGSQSSIMAAERIMAVGLASPLPMMSGAVPWQG